MIQIAEMDRNGLVAEILRDKWKDRFHTPISMREAEVALMISEGWDNQRAADRLFIAKRTLERHCGEIYEKTGIDFEQEGVSRRVVLVQIVYDLLGVLI